ncbi:Spy/CpxP family protein refolding chaperone [Ekhidna sp.]
MKKTLIILGMICMVTFVNAQGQRPERKAPPSAEQMIKKATKELSLTGDQIKQWEAIHEKYKDAMKEQQKAEETRKKMEEELEATLTEDQLEKFRKMRPKRPKRGGE